VVAPPPDADQLLTLNFDIESGLTGKTFMQANSSQPMEALNSQDVSAQPHSLQSKTKTNFAGREDIPRSKIHLFTQCRAASLGHARGHISDTRNPGAVRSRELQRWQAA
jgi:hypothetical protein